MRSVSFRFMAFLFVQAVTDWLLFMQVKGRSDERKM